MGNASWGSVITTIITYLQKIGINCSMDSLNLPPELKRIVSFAYKFYEEVENIIGSLPDFDLRSQLMVLSLALPFVLDVFLVWFINPIGLTLTHVLDLVSFGVGTYFLVTSIIDTFSFLNICIFGVCAIFIILRILFTFLTKPKNDIGLYTLVQEICNYYMAGILPDTECEITFRDLNKAIHKFSQIIEVVPPKANLASTYVFLISSTVLFFIGFWCVDAMPIPWDFPGAAKVIIPVIAFPVAVVFFVIYVLRLFQCGRVFITKTKAFLRRWGLRLLLMALDLLYIPILTCLIGMMTPAKIGCPPGEYLYYMVKNSENPIYPFVNHTAECRPCREEFELLSDQCQRKCSGEKLLRMKESPDLLFANDVVYISGGIILYVIGAVMVGLPILWYYIIRRNKKFINMVNVYGETAELKWATLIHRMKTQGTFLFEDFAPKQAFWGVVLLATRFILMALTIIADNIVPQLIFLIPVYYVTTFTLHVYYKPFIYRFNNIFESTMEFMNMVFAVFTCIVYCGVTIPDVATLPFAVIVLAVPVISVPFVLCCEGKEGTEEDEADPTILRKADTKSIKEHKKLKKKKKDDQGIYNQMLNDEDAIQSVVPVTAIEHASSHSIPQFDSKRNKDEPYKPIVDHLKISDETESSDSDYSDEIQMHRPYTARASEHPNGHRTRPATPTEQVHGLKDHLISHSKSTNNIFASRGTTEKTESQKPMSDTEKRKDDDDDDDDFDFDTDSGSGSSTNKRKRKHFHYHDAKEEKNENSGEETLPMKVEMEVRLITSIDGFNEMNKTDQTVNPEEGNQIKAFVVKRRTMARRMTKMYATLDSILDGSTIEILTKILNAAVLIGVVACGWYLGALLTKYELATNFNCE